MINNESYLKIARASLHKVSVILYLIAARIITSTVKHYKSEERRI